MNIVAETTNTVRIRMQRSDVVAMLIKAEMVPVTFGEYWSAELTSDGDGGLDLIFIESKAVNPAPRLGPIIQ